MTRAELFASVKRDINRQDKDALFPEWLAAAAFRINQQLRDERMVKRAVLPITETLFALPPDFLQPKTASLRYGVTSDTITPGNPAGNLSYFPAEQLDTGQLVKPVPFSRPTWYTVRGRYVELGPWQNTGSTYQMDLFYYAELPVVSEDGDTNWLLTRAPHIYKNAMLHFGFNHLKEFDTAAGLMGSVMAEIQQMNDNAEKEKYGSGPLIMASAKKIGGRRS